MRADPALSDGDFPPPEVSSGLSDEQTQQVVRRITSEQDEANRAAELAARGRDRWWTIAFGFVLLLFGVTQAVQRHGWDWLLFPQEPIVDRIEPYRLDINTAEWPIWMQLPGIGETLARRIVDHRNAHGPFTSIDQLDDVRGIGPKTLASIRPHLREPLGDPRPVALTAAETEVGVHRAEQDVRLPQRSDALQPSPPFAGTRESKSTD